VAHRDTFIDFLADQLDGIDDVVAKRMFGGVGLYSGEIFFAIVHKDIVYFKVDDVNRGDYVRAGTRAFRPHDDRPMTIQYYEVPVTVLEDADELCTWARAAIAAAARKPPTKKRKTPR
jgi:DNA transformation protein